MSPESRCMLPRRAFDDRYRSHRGFALVIALSLMAFVLLLVLSITTLIQVETRSAHINLRTIQARESARLALTLAIAQLQEQAGYDRRITARADLLGNEAIHPSTRFWTGVWDATNLDKVPVWLVSGDNSAPGTAPVEPMRIVGPGTVGNNPEQYVQVPTIDIIDTDGNVTSRIGWWISDEGVKASAASLPLNQRATPNVLSEDNSLQIQLATTHGLEAIFDKYDRFQSETSQFLDRISSINQLSDFADFQPSDPDALEDALFHTLTLNSYGVLASAGNTGLMQDLSLFPGLLGNGLQNYLQMGETHSKQLAAKEFPLAKKVLFTDIVGQEDIEEDVGTLQSGDIATPILPVLSNFMIAFTIRSRKGAEPNDNFLLRAKFFCEFWNPFTHNLSMTDSDGNPVNLELEITGFPKVTVQGTSDTSAPVDLQKVMGDPDHPDEAVVIRLINNEEKPWFPGRTKNWCGLKTVNGSAKSPYESRDTETKEWPEEPNTLGGSEGIDTGVTRVTGSLQLTSQETHTLRIKVYKVGESFRKLVSDLDGFLYEPVSTAGNHSNTHSGMTFGYHVNLREPYHSTNQSEFNRGHWLKDHDPRNPTPLFRTDWHTPQNSSTTGSPYIPVRDGFVAINTPQPEIINEGNRTINFVAHNRLLDRSKDSGVSLDDLWQDAPLFELPRKRVLSLASLQHIYIHNERPFQVGNSWGNQGKHNTSSWFDRYYFSGFSREDEPADLEPGAVPVNPCLRFVDSDRFLNEFPEWIKQSADDSDAARKPTQQLMVENRFNINSTSVNAWQIVLSSLRIDGFDHLNWPEEDTSDLDTLELSKASRSEGSFTRFSHSLEETYQATTAPQGLDAAPSAFYRHGARRFNDEDFETFAREIVRLLRSRGKPFESMEAFLSELSPGNGSLLEQAIRNVFTHPITGRQQWFHSWETSGVEVENESPVDIDHFAPGFLTQADIMTAIGPMLAPRSDTFKIRARSECFDTFGEKTGSATIEAILQRMPEATDPSKPLNEPADRKWKLVSMRWLTDDEI